MQVFGEDMLRHRYRVLPRINFSSPYVDLPHRLTVRQNLLIYARLYGLPRRARAHRAARRAICRSRALLDRPAGKLSSGQKTRVALAKALLNEPELLLLDEPTASLDPDTGDWVRSYLEDYRDRTGATILLASHNMGEVERLCSQVMMMKAGQIVDRGSPDELIDRYGRTNLEEVFLHIARAPQDANWSRCRERARCALGEARFSPARVWAMLLRYLYILRSSWPRTLELLYWPTLQMLIWGFMSQFLYQNSTYVARAFGVLLGAVMLWDVLFRSQLGLSISFLEEMWSRNLGHLFVTPLRPYEWVISLLAMSVIRVTIGIVPAALLAIPLYHYSIFDDGTAARRLCRRADGDGLGAGPGDLRRLILRHGMGAESLAWTVIFALSPLSCVYYPVTILPGWLQPVAWALPSTYVFEGMRAVLFEHIFRIDYFLAAAGARPRLPGGRRRDLLHRLPQRPPPRRAAADGGIAIVLQNIAFRPPRGRPADRDRGRGLRRQRADAAQGVHRVSANPHRRQAGGACSETDRRANRRVRALCQAL